MAKSSIYCTAISIFLFSAVAISATGKPVTTDDAHKLITNFIGSVKANDKTGIEECWSTASLERKGFYSSIHATIGNIMLLEEFHEFLRNRTFEITGILQEADYGVVEFDWISDVADSPPERTQMKYYIVTEHNKHVLINPIDLLTRDWLTYETDLFAFNFPQSLASRENEILMNHMDSLCHKIRASLRMNRDLSRRVDVFVTGSGLLCGELLLHPPAGGYAVMARDLIVTPVAINPHEYVHLLTMDDGDFVNAAFAEGIAVAMGGTFWSSPEFSLAITKHLVNDHRFVALKDLMLADDQSFLSNANITYHEAGAFISFLIDRFGTKELIRLSDYVDSGKDISEAMFSVYERNFTDLETEWLQYIAEVNIPEFGHNLPDDARSVFTMADNLGDDNGDGSLIYPTDGRFIPGSFDLTSFEVLADSTDIYFRIEMGEIGERVFDTSTEFMYLPGIIVAVDRGLEKAGIRKHHLNGLFFGNDGFDIKFDIGTSIILSNGYDKTINVSPDIRDIISEKENKSIHFSVPADYLGQPSDEWRFFVGVVLISDYSFGFMRSFPIPVRHTPAPFAFSGASQAGGHPFIDILLPEGSDQKKILGKARDGKGQPMPISMIGPQYKGK